jgi:hypothetical protein
VKRIITCLIAMCVLLLTACQSSQLPPPNYGQSGRRMDPTHDSPSEVDSRTLRSQDLISATDKMAQDIASRLDITNRQSPPRIFVGEIENQSSMRDRSYQVFLVRLRAELQASGARHGLEFIRERQYIEEQRQREYQGDDPASSAAAYTSRADYVLTCEIYDLPSGATNYYLLDYQLVQLRDAATGPDVGRGAIVWENMYEVKFQ